MYYLITIKAPSLCLPTMPPIIEETYRTRHKPTTEIVDKFVRYFCLKHSVELDRITFTVAKEEIKPLC